MKEEQGKRPWFLPVVRGMTAMLFALAVVLGAFGRAEGARQDCLAGSGGRWVVPVGQTVGIKLFAHGVLVVGLSDVSTQAGNCSPAKECGLKTGDIITQINDQPVNSIEAVAQAVAQSDGTLAISATRGKKELQLTAQAAPCLADGSYKLGAWVRDSMAGIGTVTFYDPESGTFAALGHGINDVDTGQLIPLQSGSIMPSKVSGIRKGERGKPGELHGSFDLTRDVGTLSANTDWGVYGHAEGGTFSGEAMEVATLHEIKTGPATIRANVRGDAVEEFAVEILRVYPDPDSQQQSILLEVTDPALLEATGGIVQGMSGSPILQNGKLVGAVTHVLVNDPTRGYGILAEKMLETAQ